MNIQEILTIWPQTNPDWANEVGTSFFAEKKDLDEFGWLDPWSRPINTTNNSHGWLEKVINVTLEGKYETVTIELVIHNLP